MTDQPEPPRLQDTSERWALPLPLPEAESPEPPKRRRWRPLSGRAEERSDPEPAPADPASVESEPVPEPDQAAGEPRPDGQPEVDPAFAPPGVEAAFGGAEAEGGPPPEVLIGAAFLGGVALAFILKRLGS